MKAILAYLLVLFGVFLFIPSSGHAQTNAQSPVAGIAQTPSSLPTVDQIIERATLASGGKEAWANITSMYISGTVEIESAHVSGTFESYSKAPNKIYQSFTIGNAVAMKQGFDGISAWKTTPAGGVVKIQGDELETSKLDAEFYSEINLNKLYPHFVLDGESTIAGRAAYAVTATPLHGKPRKLYFDKQTGLRIGLSSETTEDGKTTQVESSYEDFKTVEGIQVPYTIRILTQSFTMVLHVRDVRANTPILNSTFTMPSMQMSSPKPASSAHSENSSQVEPSGVSGNSYKSSAFGFTYTFPEGWTVASEATNQEIMKIGRDMVSGNDPTKKAVLDASVERTSKLLMVTKYPVGTPGKPNPSIQIMSERVDFAPGIRTGEDYLLNLESALKMSALPTKIADNTTEMTIGGKTFYRLNVELHLPIATIYQAYISTKLDKHALSFIISDRSPEDLETLVGTLDSLQFSTGAQ